ncbi:MAG: hypothetical protein P8M22_10180 [Phycisphaerales bacterium]|nr:hypothetical protein [Phycisphaerales bacterium]
MKTIAMLSAVSVLAATSVASAGLSYSSSFNWDDGGTVMGSYGANVTFANVADPVSGGSDRALQLTEAPLSGTPQGYVSWITGLEEGDTVDVSMWGLGDGSLTGKIRLWAHYTTSDISSYGGSASGPSDYSTSTTEWVELSNTWTFDSDGGNRTGLVIEARLYAYAGNEDPSGWVDDISVSVMSGSDDVNIMFPAVPAPGALALLGLAGLAGRKRRRN